MRGTTTLYQKLLQLLSGEKVGKKCPRKEKRKKKKERGNTTCAESLTWIPLFVFLSVSILSCGSKLPQGFSFKLLHLLLQGVVVLLPVAVQNVHHVFQNVRHVLSKVAE